VSGTDYVGGFAGNNAKDIGIAYSAGKVTGTAKNVGGFAGSNCESCNIVGAYYQSSNPSNSLAEGKTAEDMKNPEFLNELNLIAAAFKANEWIRDEASGYPVLGSKLAEYRLTNYFAEGQGSGTETYPYLISTSKHLDYLSLLVGSGRENFNGKFLKLADDLVLNPSKNFTPIGRTSVTSIEKDPTGNSFQGTFDGDNKTISGLYINSNTWVGTGLFGYVSNGGTLKNLKITDSYVKGNRCVGGLVGYIGYIPSLIENSSFSGTVTGIDRVGGIVGVSYNTEIKNSYFTGEVNGTSDYVGGLSGFNIGVIKDSYSASIVTGNNYVGGLVSINTRGDVQGTINNSYHTGTVTGNNYVGGLMGIDGVNGATNIYSMEKNYSTSTVTGNTYVGGLFGYNGIAKIENSYATGSVNGKTEVGGLVGYLNSNSKLISNSYSVGKVTGNSDKGGLIGKNYVPTGGANNSYYDKTINSTLVDTDEQGRTTTELKQGETETTFVEWDFEDTWAIDEKGIINNGYPYLKGIGEDMLICVADGKYKWGDGCEPKTDQELCDENANKVWENEECKTKEELEPSSSSTTQSSTTPSSSSSTPSSTTQSSSKPQTEKQICTASKGIWYNDYCYSTQAEVNEVKCYEKDGQYWEDGKCKKYPTPVQPATIASGKLIVRATPNAIVLENLPQNAKVEVYNLLGERIYSAYPGNPQILRILVQTKGIYLVRINNQSSLKVTM
jgi:hypothetical protein